MEVYGVFFSSLLLSLRMGIDCPTAPPPRPPPTKSAGAVGGAAFLPHLLPVPGSQHEASAATLGHISLPISSVGIVVPLQTTLKVQGRRSVIFTAGK